MCGIIGAFDPKQHLTHDSFEALRDRMTHRGPDDAGTEHDAAANVWFGHRRLSILDLSPKGHQPMKNADGTLWLVYNGEIYNYRELRKQLEAFGYSFQSKTDSEVVLHGYAQWGEDVVTHLRGMFAFGIYDQNRNGIFLARDRVGIKPLFYALTAQGFVFASELTPITASPFVTERWKPTALFDVLVFGYSSGSQTVWTDVRRLLPGHTAFLSLHNGQLVERSYWDFDFSPQRPHLKTRELQAELTDRLRETVRIHMVSDVPLGVFLSGGLDSSFVAALMARESNDPILSFSIGFKEQAFNELPIARALAQRYQTRHFEELVTIEQMRERFPSVYDGFGEPYTDPSAVPMDALCELARPHMTVALSGDGGDELFVGYRRYLKMYYLYLLQRIPGWRRLARSCSMHQEPWRRQKGFCWETQLPTAAAYASARAKIAADAARRLLPPEWQREVATYDPYEMDRRLFEQGLERGFDLMGCMRYVDAKTWLPDDVLTKVDRMAMRHSLEVRVPFLDHLFIESVQQLPSRTLMGSQPLRPRLKSLLKAMARPSLPSVYFKQPKRGFELPIKEWFRNPLYCQQMLLREGADWFQEQEIGRMIALHTSQRRDLDQGLWVLQVLRQSCLGLGGNEFTLE